MRIVVDANLVAAIVLPLSYSDQTAHQFTAWNRAGTELHAPLLLEYEVASVMRKAVVAGWMSTGEAAEAMRDMLALNIRRLPPTSELHKIALQWAERLGQSKAYDAHYLALAEQLKAELWTADRRLVNGARQAGAAWVHWIGENETP